MPCSLFISISIQSRFKGSVIFLRVKKISKHNTVGYRTQKYVFQDAKKCFTITFYLFIFNEIVNVYLSLFIKCRVVQFNFFAFINVHLNR